MEEVPSAGAPSAPHALADDALRPWSHGWAARESTPLQLPSDSDSWSDSPPLTAFQVHDVVVAYKAAAATGPMGIRPRALLHLSLGACEALAILLNLRERSLGWPAARIASDL